MSEGPLIIPTKYRESAQCLLSWIEDKNEPVVKAYLKNIANGRSILPSKDPLVVVEAGAQDNCKDEWIYVEEAIPLSLYLEHVVEGDKMTYETSFGAGCYGVDMGNSRKWDVDWAKQGVSEERYGMWAETTCMDNDNKKRVKDFMDAHGYFDPEKDKVPTWQDVEQNKKQKTSD